MAQIQHTLVGKVREYNSGFFIVFNLSGDYIATGYCNLDDKYSSEQYHIVMINDENPGKELAQDTVYSPTSATWYAALDIDKKMPVAVTQVYADVLTAAKEWSRRVETDVTVIAFEVAKG